MKKLGNMIQTKEQDKAPVSDPNEREVHELPDKESKIMVIKMLTEIKRTICGQSKNFNK